MSMQRDAAFLCGFILGTYDLKGEQEVPKSIKPFIDRIMSEKITDRVEIDALNIEIPEIIPSGNKKEVHQADISKIKNITHSFVTQAKDADKSHVVSMSTAVIDDHFREVHEDDAFKKEEKMNTSTDMHSKYEHIEDEPIDEENEEKAAIISKRKLTDDDKRMIVKLLEREGKKWKEIAFEVGCKEGTAYAFYANHRIAGDLQKWRGESSIKKEEPPHRLMENHDEYVGKRDPDQKLIEEDWAAIQRQLQKGKSHITLAQDYNVSRKIMDKFVDDHLLADAREVDSKARGPRPLKLPKIDDPEPLEEADF